MSSIHSGGVGTPGVPGPEAEIRRLRRRVLELEETNRALHERSQGLVVQASTAASLMMETEMLRGQVTALTRERDEARAAAEAERKRADHHAAEHAAAVKELAQAQAKSQKGGRR